MTDRKFTGFVVAVFVTALGIRLFTASKGRDIQLIGVVDGNEVVVTPEITGRIVKPTLGEGSEGKEKSSPSSIARSFRLASPQRYQMSQAWKHKCAGRTPTTLGRMIRSTHHSNKHGQRRPPLPRSSSRPGQIFGVINWTTIGHKNSSMGVSPRCWTTAKST